MPEGQAPDAQSAPETQSQQSQNFTAGSQSWDQGGTSFSSTVPQAAPVSANGESKVDFASFIPEEYKAKEFVVNALKSENPAETLFKMYDNAQSMIGKSAGLIPPSETSTPEQIAQWNKAIGVPETVDGYKYESPKWAEADQELGKFLENSRPPEFLTKVKEIFREAGIPADKFGKIAQGYDQLWLEANREEMVKAELANKALNEDFDAVTARLFGDRKDQVLKVGHEYIQKHVPAEMRPILMNADNNTLAMFAALIDNHHRSNVAEGSFSTKDASATGGQPRTQQEIQSAMTKIMARPEYRNFRLNGHDEAVKEVEALGLLANQLPGK